MTTRLCSLVFAVPLLCCVAFWDARALAQPLGLPDRGAPGDEMIQRYLQHEAAKLSAGFADDISTLQNWEAKRPQYVEEYFYMLGLSPLPERTALRATVTGTLAGGGFVVEGGIGMSRPLDIA